MEKLFENQRVILEQFSSLPFYDREVFKIFSFSNQICGIVGSRGVGKTTLLLHLVQTANAKKQQALYISVDNVYFLKNNIVDLVDSLYKETHVRLLCIDEIHKYPNWDQELKNIYDTYFDFKIVFTGSSQIDIVHSKYDLSRRVTLYHLYGLSFREYLEINLQKQFPIIQIDELIKKHTSIAASLQIKNILPSFYDYLRIGYYPFFNKFVVEIEKYQAINNIVQKVIYEDIGTFHKLKTPTLYLIEKLYKFVLNSAPGEISASKLASNLAKDFDNISDYLHYLEQAGLTRFLYPKKSGQAFLRNPTKMYPENTNMMYAALLPISYDNLMGKIRETFALNQIQNANLTAYYSDVGDFQVLDYNFEIGGKNKTNHQIKDHKNSFIYADGILTGHKNRIPLYLLGFLS